MSGREFETSEVVARSVREFDGDVADAFRRGIGSADGVLNGGIHNAGRYAAVRSACPASRWIRVRALAFIGVAQND